MNMKILLLLVSSLALLAETAKKEELINVVEIDSYTRIRLSQAKSELDAANKRMITLIESSSTARLLNKRDLTDAIEAIDKARQKLDDLEFITKVIAGVIDSTGVCSYPQYDLSTIHYNSYRTYERSVISGKYILVYSGIEPCVYNHLAEVYNGNIYIVPGDSISIGPDASVNVEGYKVRRIK